jgi:ABC-type transport system substrate-binding protein
MPPRSTSSRSRLLLLCIVALGPMAASCPAAPVPPPDGATARASGTIRLAYPEWPATLNPVTEASPGARDILRAVLPTFHVVTPDLEYRPSLLAEEPTVEVEDQRMTVTFRLRPDARWNDGRPITVADVAFTVEVMQDPDLERVDPEGFERVVEVVEEAPDRGRLVLSPPLPTWRELFSAGRFVLPAHVAEEISDVATWDEGPPVSGGPFRVANVVDGRSVMLERNARYWGSPAQAHRIEVLAVPDPTTALQLLRDGRVDVVAPMLGVSWGYRLSRLDGVGWAGAFGSHLVALVENVDRLGDRRARRGLIEAVDRGRFLRAVLQEEGRAAFGLFPEGSGWPRQSQGPARRFVPREELQLVYIRTELLELTARYLQAEVEAAGGDLELVGLEADVFWSTFLPGRRFDLALVEVRGSPEEDVSGWVGPPDGIWSSLTGAEIPAQGSAAVVQEELASRGVVLPMYQLRTTMGWRSGVQGVVPNPSVEGPLWNAEAWTVGEV